MRLISFLRSDLHIILPLRMMFDTNVRPVQQRSLASQTLVTWEMLSF